MRSENVLAAACKLARMWFSQGRAWGESRIRVKDQLKTALDYHAGNRHILCTMKPCTCPACIVREAEGLGGEPVACRVSAEEQLKGVYHLGCPCVLCESRKVDAGRAKGNPCPWVKCTKEVQTRACQCLECLASRLVQAERGDPY